MPQTLLRKSQRLILVLGILPGVLALAAYFTSSQHIESVQSTIRTTVFLRDLDDLLSTLKDAETGQRGFILTAQPKYLEPYFAARRELPVRWQPVLSEGKREGVAEADLARIQQLSTQKLDELVLTIRLRQESGFPAALAVINTDRGRAYMSELRALIGKIREERQSALAKTIVLQKHRQKILNATLALGVAAGAALLFFAYRFSSRYERQRNQLEKDIREIVRERTAELEQRTQELERRSLDLQRSNDDLLQFAYVASHDLQEPLRTVASYVGLLAHRYQGQLDETAKKYIEFAVSGAERMQTLISDLLRYSKAGTQALERRPVSMDQVVKIVLENLAAGREETGARITAEALPIIEGDEKQLIQVLQNLIANAIKFHKLEEAPDISISAVKKDNTEWIFAVNDNGIGFDEKYLDRIFQVFQRLHGIGKYPGTGIGLAICRRIIEQHGGKMWATSSPGIGSTFFFSLPATEKNR